MIKITALALAAMFAAIPIASAEQVAPMPEDYAKGYRLTGGEATREIWLDGQGRVLRVSVAEQGYLAER